MRAEYFGSLHAVTRVNLCDDRAINSLVKAWPAGMAVKFCIRGKKKAVAVCAVVVARVKGVDERTAKRCFGGFVKEDGFLGVVELWILYISIIRFGV